MEFSQLKWEAAKGPHGNRVKQPLFGARLNFGDIVLIFSFLIVIR